MKPIEPLSWLDNNHKELKREIISWFNDKMDMLVSKHELIQFNNDSNTLSDLVDHIKDMALMSITPDSGANRKEFGYYISVMCHKDDLSLLTHRYCKQKFNKILTT